MGHIALYSYSTSKKLCRPRRFFFVYFTEYQAGNGGYVCLKVCRYYAATVPLLCRLLCRHYAAGECPSKTLSLLLGIAARSFGRTRTVVWAYANGRKQHPSPLPRCCLNPAETLFTPHQDAASDQEERCFQQKRTVLSTKKNTAFLRPLRKSRLSCREKI